MRGNPFGAAWGEGFKKCTGWRANVRPPGISGLWGASLSARLQHSISKSDLVLQPPVYVHLPERRTRSSDLDQRSLENRDTKWTGKGSGRRPSCAQAHPCGHMACARVKRKWEPTEAPPPVPSLLKASPANESSTQLLTETGTAGVLTSWDLGLCLSLFSTCRFWETNKVFSYSIPPHTNYNKMLTVLHKENSSR